MKLRHHLEWLAQKIDSHNWINKGKWKPGIYYLCTSVLYLEPIKTGNTYGIINVCIMSSKWLGYSDDISVFKHDDTYKKKQAHMLDHLSSENHQYHDKKSDWQTY